MLWRTLTVGALALVLAAPAEAQPRMLMPGVTYEQNVAFTSHGPVVYHVMTAPRPGGLYTLRPVLSNGFIQGTETLTAMQRRVSGAATVAGVNGDFFNWKVGHPTGILIQGGVLHHRPSAERSSVGIDGSGNLRVERVSYFGTWQGLGQRRALDGLNEPPKGNGASLYTPAWGPTTPVDPSVLEVTISPLGQTVPNIELGGAVVTAVRQGGGSPIPAGGGVIAARGAMASKITAEAPVGQAVAIRLILKPDWTPVLEALGGGPIVVRDGKPVFRANELFSPDQLQPREPRTAVGQRADGRIILLTVDGRQPGYSVGMTNFELGQTLARLGAVTGSALDAGGSTTMAFDGQLLNRPSDPGGERSIAEGLLVSYTGVYAPPAREPVLSPNGDGVAEQQSLSYKLVRPSTVTAALVGPDGVARRTETALKAPGVYRLDWNGRVTSGAADRQGRWQWLVRTEDDLAQRSVAERTFWLNQTLGFLRREGRALAVPRKTPRVVAAVTVANAASLVATVETRGGASIDTIATGRVAPGRIAIRWDGRDRNGTPVYPGTYVVRVAATNAFRRVELTTEVRVFRARPKPVRR